MKKVKIYTFADKAPQFIPLQYKSFGYIKDDFEYIVMNNGSSPELIIQIRSECEKLGVRCLDVINKDFSTAAFACAAPIQECIDWYISKDKDCYSVILDSDMFFYADLNINEYMQGWDIAGLPQSRNAGYKIVEYIWNGLIIFDNDTLPNLGGFDIGCGTIWHAKGDVGLFSYYYLLCFPEVKWKRIPCTSIITPHPEVVSLIPEHVRNDYEFRFDMEIVGPYLIHFRGGSKWNYPLPGLYEAKEAFIKKMIG